MSDWKPVTNGQTPTGKLVKVMYSNGFVSPLVQKAEAWENWIGSRNWWKPQADRLHITAYVVI